MHEGIYIAASGGAKQQKKLDIIANNLANVNTTGFKKDSILFKEMMPPFTQDTRLETSRNILLPPDKSNKNVAYVGVNDFYTDHTAGAITKTGNPLDLALEGPGFFKVQTEQGIRYTRTGNFSLDKAGRLMSQDGNPILGENDRPVEIDTTGGQITIDSNANISIGRGLENVPVGKLTLVEFDDTSSLVKEGNGIFRMTDPNRAELPAQKTRVRQGFVEASNVNAIKEMTDMISTMRIFEAYQKMITAIDNVDSQAISNIGRVV